MLRTPISDQAHEADQVVAGVDDPMRPKRESASIASTPPARPAEMPPDRDPGTAKVKARLTTISVSASAEDRLPLAFEHDARRGFRRRRGAPTVTASGGDERAAEPASPETM